MLHCQSIYENDSFITIFSTKPLLKDTFTSCVDSNNHFHYVKGLNKQKQINQLPTKLLRIKKKCISELSRQVLNCHAIPHWLQERVKIRIMQTITPHFKRSHYTRFSLPPSHSKCQGAEQGAKRLKYLCSSKAVG